MAKKANKAAKQLVKTFTLLIIGAGQALSESEIPEEGPWCCASYGGNTSLGANQWILNPEVMARFVPLGNSLILRGDTDQEVPGVFPSNTETEADKLFYIVQQAMKRHGYKFGGTESIVNGISPDTMTRPDRKTGEVGVPAAPLMSILVSNLQSQVS